MKLQCVWAIVLFFVRAGRYMHISIDFVMSSLTNFVYTLFVPDDIIRET